MVNSGDGSTGGYRMLPLTKEEADKFPHRWIVVTESFFILEENRFEYENYASLGAAQDARDRINRRAELGRVRVRASILDKQMWK